MQGKPVLTKLGAVKKVRSHPVTREKSIKTRLIVDSNESGTTRAASRTHKSAEQRVTTAVHGILGLMALRWRNLRLDALKAQAAETGVEFLVADVNNAFWLVPPHPADRRLFIVKHGGVFVVFERTAQGSRGAPLSWAAVASLLARVAQSLLLSDDGRGQEGRLQVYVGDPLLAVKGTPGQARCLRQDSWHASSFWA